MTNSSNLNSSCSNEIKESNIILHIPRDETLYLTIRAGIYYTLIF